jgi:hypothetical protein
VKNFAVKFMSAFTNKSATPLAFQVLKFKDLFLAGDKLRTEAEQKGSEELRDAAIMWSLHLQCFPHLPKEELHA